MNSNKSDAFAILMAAKPKAAAAIKEDRNPLTFMVRAVVRAESAGIHTAPSACCPCCRRASCTPVLSCHKGRKRSSTDSGNPPGPSVAKMLRTSGTSAPGAAVPLVHAEKPDAEIGPRLLDASYFEVSLIIYLYIQNSASEKSHS